jgi:putative intracellular protease/amidase
MALSALAAGIRPAAAANATAPAATTSEQPSKPGPRQVNIVLVPRMVQLDVTGPFEVLARVPGWSISLVAATLEPVRTDRGLRITPDVTREGAAQADLLVVPGGMDRLRAAAGSVRGTCSRYLHGVAGPRRSRLAARTACRGTLAGA